MHVYQLGQGYLYAICTGLVNMGVGISEVLNQRDSY